MFDREMEWLASIEARTCPSCEQHIASATKRSYCIYAMPCGHKLGGKDRNWLLALLNTPESK